MGNLRHIPVLRWLAAARADCCFVVPKGQAKIAQRFNAGLDAKASRVPGRPRSNPTPHPSAVPDTGLVSYAGCFPALKRRAILKMSLRDKATWYPPFPASKQLDALALPSRAFRGYAVQPGVRHDRLPRERGRGGKKLPHLEARMRWQCGSCPKGSMYLAWAPRERRSADFSPQGCW